MSSGPTTPPSQSRTQPVIHKRTGWLEIPTRRPIWTLLIAVAITALAAWQASKLQPNATMQSMVDGQSAAGRAMVRLARDFDAMNDLLLLVTTGPGAESTFNDKSLHTPTEAAVVTPHAPSAPNSNGPWPTDGALPTSGHATNPQAERLLAFAQRLEAAIHADPDAAGLCRRVTYQPGPEVSDFLRRVAQPTFLYYLDEPSFKEFKARLTPQRIRQQIGMTNALLAAPIVSPAGGLSGLGARDPLRLYELALAAAQARTGSSQPDGWGDRFLSPDGRALLIRVTGTRPSSDLAFADEITQTIQRVVDQINDAHVSVRMAGGYAIAAANHHAIRRDMIGSVIGSVVALQLVFLLLYRRPLTFLIAFVPVAMGITWGFGCFAAFWPSVSPLGAVSGAVLAGLSVDYSIHFLSYYSKHRAHGLTPPAALLATLSHISKAMVTACATSVVGFGVVLWKDVPVLRDFSIIAILGLAGSLLATLTVLPAILSLTDHSDAQNAGQQGNSRSFDAVMSTIATARWAFPATCLVAMCLLSVLAVTGWGVAHQPAPSSLVQPVNPSRATDASNTFPTGGDLAIFHAYPNPPLETQRVIAETFGHAQPSIFVHLRAESEAQLVTLAHNATRRVLSHTDALNLDRVFSLAALLPDPSATPGRAEAMRQIDAPKVLNELQSALAQSALSATVQERYLRFVETILAAGPPPTVKTLTDYPTLAATVLPNPTLTAVTDINRPAHESMLWLFFRKPITNRAARDNTITTLQAALADLPGATVTGPTVLAFETERQILSGSVEFALAVAAAVLGWLLAHFRAPSVRQMVGDALLCLVPVLFGLWGLIVYLKLAGEQINMVNLLVFPVLIGIGVDYGVFLVDARRKAVGKFDATAPSPLGNETLDPRVPTLAACCHAVLAASLTTALSFGSLVFTSVPAIQSLGRVMAVGVAACFVGAVFVLAPVLWVGAASSCQKAAA